MVSLILLLLVGLYGFAMGLPTNSIDASQNEIPSYSFPLIPRAQWKARIAKDKNTLSNPVAFVVIHHSYTPGACNSSEECGQAMRSMQDFHMDDRRWWDIGYNFAVGGDGAAYEGRGWNTTGAQALHFNDVSIGICLIGDWRSSLPPANQLKAAKALIAAGVELGFVRPNYKLIGHRQVRDTECPGDALYTDIKTWRQYSEHPSSVEELKFVEELPERVKALLNKKSTS